MNKKKIRFFSDEKSTINKGYDNQKKFDNIKYKSDNQSILSFLPNVEILYKYEDMYPGSIESILNIVKKEQENQFCIEQKKVLHNSAIKIFKYIALLLFCCAICFTTLSISFVNLLFGILFAIGVFVFILLLSIIVAVYKIRSKSTKKHIKSYPESIRNDFRKKSYASKNNK